MPSLLDCISNLWALLQSMQATVSLTPFLPFNYKVSHLTIQKKKKKKSCVQSIDLRYINKRCIDRNKHASIDKVYFYNIYRPVSKCKAFFSFTF